MQVSTRRVPTKSISQEAKLLNLLQGKKQVKLHAELIAVLEQLNKQILETR